MQLQSTSIMSIAGALRSSLLKPTQSLLTKTHTVRFTPSSSFSSLTAPSSHTFIRCIASSSLSNRRPQVCITSSNSATANVVPHRLIHSTRACRGLNEFFENAHSGKPGMHTHTQSNATCSCDVRRYVYMVSIRIPHSPCCIAPSRLASHHTPRHATQSSTHHPTTTHTIHKHIQSTNRTRDQTQSVLFTLSHLRALNVCVCGGRVVCA